MIFFFSKGACRFVGPTYTCAQSSGSWYGNRACRLGRTERGGCCCTRRDCKMARCIKHRVGRYERCTWWPSREAFCAQSTRMYACLLAHGLVCVALPRYSVRRPYNSNLVAFSLHSIHPQLDLGNLHLSVYLCVICSHACTRARARTHICLGPLPSVPDHRQPETPRGRKTIQSLAMDGAACSWAGCFRRLKRQRWRQSCQHPHSRGGWDRTWVRGYGKFDPKEHCDQFFQHIDRRRGRAVESCSSRRSFLRYWRLQCCRTLVWCIHVGRHAAVSWPLMAFPSLRLCLSPSLYG